MTSCRLSLLETQEGDFVRLGQCLFRENRFHFVSILKITLFLSLYLGSVQWVWARQDLIPGSRYTSARAAGMGDAALPLGDDVASGLFYNPANLGRMRHGTLEPLNLSLGANHGFINVADSSATNAPSLAKFAPTLNRKPGQLAGMGGALLPSFGFPGFAFGVLMQSELAAQSNGDGTLSYKSLYQLVPAIGGGYKLFHGIIRFGYSLQWVNQASGAATVSESADIGYDKNLVKGSTLSHNFGIALTAPIRSLPSINLVVRNALNSSYRSLNVLSVGDGSQGVPATEQMTVDASFSIQPRIGRGANLTLSLVNRDATNRSGDAFIAHFALGGELAFLDTVFFRGGWSGGYPALGFGLKRPGAELSLAWYSEEIGTHYLDKRDIKYMLQYQLRAF